MLLKKLNFGDGYKGWPAFAPFDKIISYRWCSISYLRPLLAQLKIGGRLVIPVGDDVQTMTLYIIRKWRKRI